MLALMRDPQVPLDERIDLAAAAAPFVHARPEPARNKRPDPLDLRDRLGDSGDLKFGRLEATSATDWSGGGDGGLSPLDFLLGVMGDPAVTPRQRVKAAAIAARYKHAYAGGTEAPTVLVVEDKFGFKVDPELARAERDDSVREDTLRATSHMRKKDSVEAKAAEQELEQIGKRRAERLALVRFPAGYTYGDRQDDTKRLAQLYSKRLSRKKLTAEEDAEEAHLAVRVLSPVPVPKPREPAPEMECPMSRMVELEERVLAGDTTAADEEGLQDLRSRYPEIAADVDRLDHRYRYWLRREQVIGRKAGLDWWDAYRAAEEKCERLRDRRKMATVEDLRNGPFARIYILETLRFDQQITPEEADELEELHRWYPERAEKVHKLVVRRLTELQERRRLGFTSSDEEWPRMKAPRR